MAYEKTVHMLAGGAVMIECGPMRLVIDARVGKVAQPQQALRAADEAVRFLEGVATARPFLGRDYRGFTPQITDPLALKMVASIQAVGDEDLTPMAAVAGTIADAVADFLFERGMTRVLVDNGGDVAIRCCDGEPVAVGIRPNVESKRIAQVMVLGPERTAWGIATSGLGGRSLTRGVLEAATVVAADASLADAAATAVANASYVEDSAVVQAPAEAIDPRTDIAGLPRDGRCRAAAGRKKEPGGESSHPPGREADRQQHRFGCVRGMPGADGHDAVYRRAAQNDLISKQGMVRSAILSVMKFRPCGSGFQPRYHRGPPRRTPTEKHTTSLETCARRRWPLWKSGDTSRLWKRSWKKAAARWSRPASVRRPSP